MYLYLNTTDSNFIILATLNKKGVILKLQKIKAPYQQSEKLLTAVEKILNAQMTKLSGMIAVVGPGGFTSLRIGLATANALTYALNLPIVGIKKGQNKSEKELIREGMMKIKKVRKFKQLMPFYGQAPKIS
jgi:tRNA A37 threonylcarbamoyladenosine modification protein TsaB